jgi:pyridinium-3,5-biscarboxylic acid mononucleotide synthase
MPEREVKLDFQRPSRLGFDEAIFCAGKSESQLAIILAQAAERDASLLLTRLQPEVLALLDEGRHGAIDYDPASQTGFFNWRPLLPAEARVGVITAGSSDVPVAREAVRTLTYYGIATHTVFDVGVAGLWRLLQRVEELKTLPVLIAVAGMDAALPSVLGGLVPGVVIAVPTSTGYGAARGGETALASALVSCAPGLTVVNIDNGYGAACAALRVLRLLDGATPAAPR